MPMPLDEYYASARSITAKYLGWFFFRCPNQSILMELRFKKICFMFQQCLAERFYFVKQIRSESKLIYWSKCYLWIDLWSVFSMEIISLSYFMIEESFVDLRALYESQYYLRIKQLTGDQTIIRFVNEVM